MEEIEKIIVQNELTKPFLCSVIDRMRNKNKKTAASAVKISLSKFAISSKKIKRQEAF